MPVSPTLPRESIPHVTVIRPVKGLEPALYECLAATFRQSYPSTKLTIYFCISSKSDPALNILERLVQNFPSFDAKIFIEEEDPNLALKDGKEHNLGPNPKIRNMSRAYREAKGDIIWIVDCNVWIGPSTAGLMVDLLCGFSPNYTKPRPKYKFVHQLPLVTDITSPSMSTSFTTSLLTHTGSLLEELFLSTSHAKFYVAISTVAIAPCTVGKSNMFRRSHLDELTPSSDTTRRDPGIDYFSSNICEDHLIGDLLWKTPVPDTVRSDTAVLEDLSEREIPSNQDEAMKISRENKWRNHAMLSNPPCIQPLQSMPLISYIKRRTRWLRVRKFTVPAATLVEPGTESMLCSLYGAFGLTTYLPCNTILGIPRTWTAFWIIWIISMLLWVTVDYQVAGLLMHCASSPSQNLDGGNDRERIPFGNMTSGPRPLREWLFAWLGREVLAPVIWLWAIFGGTKVDWRGGQYWVGLDMKVHEVDDGKKGNGKARVE